jgi:hypothetical protein
MQDGKARHLGAFPTPQKAALARDYAIRAACEEDKWRGGKPRKNFPVGGEDGLNMIGVSFDKNAGLWIARKQIKVSGTLSVPHDMIPADHF